MFNTIMRRNSGMEWFNGKKTHIISACMVIVSIVNLVAGDLSLTEFVRSNHMTTLFEAFGLSTLRMGILQNQKETTHEIVKSIHFPHAG